MLLITCLTIPTFPDSLARLLCHGSLTLHLYLPLYLLHVDVSLCSILSLFLSSSNGNPLTPIAVLYDMLYNTHSIHIHIPRYTHIHTKESQISLSSTTWIFLKHNFKSAPLVVFPITLSAA